MPANERIGDLLVQRGRIDRDTAEAIAQQCATSPMRYASLLVDEGLVSEPEVLQLLAEQHGLPALHIEQTRPHRAALAKVPHEVAARLSVLPVLLDGQQLHLAMADPQDQVARDEISFGTGCTVLPYVALYTHLQTLVGRAYGVGADAYTDAKPHVPLPLVVASLPALQVPAPDMEVAGPTLDNGTIVEERRGSAQTILVVEDEPVSRALIMAALRPTGCTLIATGDGLSALKIIKTRQPILIVLDAVLPEVHGFEICRKIKESKRFANTPVLMISAGYRGWETVNAILTTYRADAFLEKPFSVQAMRQQVDSLIKKSPAAESVAAMQAQSDTPYFAAVEALQAGKIDTALQRLREAEEVDPFSAKVQFVLGQTFERNKRPFQAVYHYERASQLDPVLFPALRTLAQLYNELGFTQKATQAWVRAEKCAPTPAVRQQIHDYLVKTA